MATREDPRRAYMLLPAVIMAGLAGVQVANGQIVVGGIAAAVSVALLTGGIPGGLALWRHRSRFTQEYR